MSEETGMGRGGEGSPGRSWAVSQHCCLSTECPGPTLPTSHNCKSPWCLGGLLDLGSAGQWQDSRAAVHTWGWRAGKEKCLVPAVTQ